MLDLVMVIFSSADLVSFIFLIFQKVLSKVVSSGYTLGSYCQFTYVSFVCLIGTYTSLYTTLGFNCAEAVNFAIGDWFPSGSVASQLYGLLNRMPLLPYEELLCREAMLLFKRSSFPESKDLVFSTAELHSRHCVKVSFAQLMRFQRRARGSLIKLGARTSFYPSYQGIMLCSLCKRDCYVTYVKCNCYMNPICLHHGMDISYFALASVLRCRASPFHL